VNSVYVNSDGKKAKTTVVAATDGHRLATAWLPKSDVTALIQKQTLQILFSPPFKASREVDMISLADKAVVFPLKTGYLTSKLNEGTFPSVEQIIPDGTSTQAVIAANRTGLITTLNRAIALAQDRTAPVTIIGDPGSSISFTPGTLERSGSLVTAASCRPTAAQARSPSASTPTISRAPSKACLATSSRSRSRTH
jgi:DNA polymerase III sliding clamp (beta) subunit (PCNA family)